ncbi:DNA polymerase III subunit alpha [Geobacter sp. SVR]|uniref:DNA polymerase III subunit alpha n=1 Tax=Geobacter sp. SVR TaxID=2495594 RepID=UPI00143EFE87|nr:DNA polymerase III subunit alpha [Geobacter sp. SVR]BCS54706.1 DNA-directed DNA polymerase [Geobacter sp. SVR]GCF86486.1 DNA-directed DNA polymerase [Geobacter sp. SVR]
METPNSSVASDTGSAPPFVHLHLHTQYSLLDGAIRLEDLIAKAKAHNMPAVAITDHGNMFGAVEFYLKCKKAGIKPIIGCEVYLAPDSRFARDSKGISDAAYHLVLLCENLVGYKNLSYLTSAGYKEGFYYRPRIDRELLEKHAEGLIALSACLKGEVAMQCGRGRMDEALETARWYSELFPGRYYIELQENTLPEQDVVNKRLLEVATELNLPLVATNDCHYLNREDARAHEVLLCIQTGKTMSDPTHMKFSADEFYVKTPGEMAAAFSYAPQAIANTVAIAERCNIELPLEKEYYFPHFEPPPGQNHDDMLEQLATEGLKERMSTILAKYPDMSLEQQQSYFDRLRIELDCIRAMKFPAYFLIVSDFITWAKNKGIPVGPGRGSAAGSLVAYAIKITDLDPLPYNLLFERFLNPERISMPDIDVDFCQDRREEVIQYVVEKYGRERVCQIITFGTMKAKAVVRDVGRALNMAYGDVDRIAKLVPDDLKMTLEKAIKQEPQLKELADADPQVKDLLDTALCLEGLTRHASTHAAGVVVAPNQMEEYLPVYKDQKTGSINTQYSMKYVEMVGLVKFDFLGLKNLTVIQNAVRLVKEKNPDFDITRLRDDDQASYDLITAGNTTGIFQLESSGMKEMLVKLKPSCFEDVIAACALYRPGPLGCGMVDDFIERKHGRQKVVYDLPQLEPILKDTYGVIVYQEQVMQISRTLAGYSLGRADLLRRAMGKKDPLVMAKEKEPFLEGAKAQGLDPKKAEAIFDQMAKFAEYGFNKSHSAAYALIAYQTAYLKAHYPVEFMAALLTCDMDSTDKVIKNIADCREQGIEVLPPDINKSGLSFTVVGHSMRFGLGAVKGVGTGAVEAILEARGDEPFKDIFDFCERIDMRRANKKVLEALIKCGAFDSTKAHRAALMEGLEAAMSYGQKIQEEKASAQVSLFGTAEVVKSNGNGGMKLPNAAEWHDKQKLAFEKEALGFLITGHPLDRYIDDIKRLASSEIARLTEQADGSEVRVCGIVSSLKEIITKKGDRMGFVTIEDLTGSVEITVFSDIYTTAVSLLKSDDPLLITGKLERGEKGAKILVQAAKEGGSEWQQKNRGPAGDIKLLSEARSQTTKRVLFTLRLDETPADRLDTFKEIISRHPGSVPACIQFLIPERSRSTLPLSPDLNVAASDDLRLEVERLFGYNAATFE